MIIDELLNEIVKEEGVLSVREKMVIVAMFSLTKNKETPATEEKIEREMLRLMIKGSDNAAKDEIPRFPPVPSAKIILCDKDRDKDGWAVVSMMLGSRYIEFKVRGNYGELKELEFDYVTILEPK